MRRLLLFPVIALALAGCKYGRPDFDPPPPSSTRLPSAEDAVHYESMNEFAFRLAHETGLGGGNGVISPLAVNQSLALLLNASDGDTNHALTEVLGVVGERADGFNASHRSLLNLMNSAPGSPLHLASSLWTVWPIVLDKWYIKNMGAQFDASVTRIGGYRVEAVRMVNDWADERTSGEITSIVDKLSKEDVVLLISVAVFDGDFATALKLEADASAFRAPGREMEVRLLRGSGEYRHYEDDEVQAVALPYAGGVFEMVVVLPAGDTTVEELVEQTDADRFMEITNGMVTANGVVRLPRFAVQSDYELSPAVASMGGDILFTKRNNFRKLSIEMDSGYGVSMITHRAIVRVAGEGRASSGGGGRFDFRADRPFLYAIVEQETGAIVMLGVVSEPKA